MTSSFAVTDHLSQGPRRPRWLGGMGRPWQGGPRRRGQQPRRRSGPVISRKSLVGLAALALLVIVVVVLSRKTYDPQAEGAALQRELATLDGTTDVSVTVEDGRGSSDPQLDATVEFADLTAERASEALEVWQGYEGGTLRPMDVMSTIDIGSASSPVSTHALRVYGWDSLPSADELQAGVDLVTAETKAAEVFYADGIRVNVSFDADSAVDWHPGFAETLDTVIELTGGSDMSVLGALDPPVTFEVDGGPAIGIPFDYLHAVRELAWEDALLAMAEINAEIRDFQTEGCGFEPPLFSQEPTVSCEIPAEGATAELQQAVADLQAEVTAAGGVFNEDPDAFSDQLESLLVG